MRPNAFVFRVDRHCRCARDGRDRLRRLIEHFPVLIVVLRQCADTAALEQSGAWSSVSSISASSFAPTPICHITTADSATTIRIYTAKPDGNDSLTTQLCAAMAQGFGAK